MNSGSFGSCLKMILLWMQQYITPHGYVKQMVNDSLTSRQNDNIDLIVCPMDRVFADLLC